MRRSWFVLLLICSAQFMVTLDVTVSAGELLEAVDESGATAAVPGAVTGPPWAGVLPPRGGWQA